MSFLARRRADRVYRKGGWGPQLTWPVPRADGAPLVFQMRLPAKVQLIDVDKLAESAEEAPEFVTEGRTALARGAEALGAIVVGALCGTADDGEREVLGTVTVALAGVTGPPDLNEGVEVDGNRRTHTTVIKLSDRATEIKRLIAETVPDRAEPVPMLMMQYLIETRYGALTMSFSTANTDMFGEFGRSMFLKITETGFIGEKPAPY
jgi:hypothetical protein